MASIKLLGDTSGEIIISAPAVAGTNTLTLPATSGTLLDSTSSSVGLHTINIPAGALTTRTTNGAAGGTVETTTNKLMLKTLDFDAATEEYAQFTVRMPKSWDEGTVTAYVQWSHAATTTNFGVTWGLQAVAISNDDALDVAFGTGQVIADTGGTTDDLYQTAVTPAITVGGTPQELDYITFQVYRSVADGGDTMAIDARLHGVVLMYTTDAATDA
tara:strand:- start:953 stop:1600 length:648 start_codon:yes stop_codon:yes gene_type:complete